MMEYDIHSREQMKVVEFTGSFAATGLEDRAGGSSRFGMIYGWQKQGGLKFEKHRSLAARISLQISPICDRTNPQIPPCGDPPPKTAGTEGWSCILDVAGIYEAA